jgi:hypothetical protein
MKLTNYFKLIFTVASLLASGMAYSQRGGNIPELIPFPMEFETSREHYDYLLDHYEGGVVHDYLSVPKWEGLWSAGGDSGIRQQSMFLDDGEIIPGVLTPEYEAAFRYRLDLADQAYNAGVDFDRLTTCEPAGIPRWYMEPYVREFLNTPTYSLWHNDLANDMRRIYINQEHINIDGTHFAAGDSIGFWAVDEELGDVLVVHTEDIYPADFFRGTPPTSNQAETVEVWYEWWDAENDQVKIAVNVYFYDELMLEEPLNLVYTYQYRQDMIDAGLRIRYWECAQNDNTYLTFDDEGRPMTQYRLPGEPGYVDPRGAARYRNPDLPVGLIGQEKNPIFDDAFDFDFGQ